MIGFDGIVRVLLHDMARGWQQLIEYPRVGMCPVGAHLGRVSAVLERTGEEPAGGHQIPLLGHQHVDDLPELVDRPIQVDSSPGDLHIRLIHKPAITGGVPAGPGRVDQQRSEPLHHLNTVT
jgi:hypothetical protein